MDENQEAVDFPGNMQPVSALLPTLHANGTCGSSYLFFIFHAIITYLLDIRAPHVMQSTVTAAGLNLRTHHCP